MNRGALIRGVALLFDESKLDNKKEETVENLLSKKIILRIEKDDYIRYVSCVVVEIKKKENKDEAEAILYLDWPHSSSLKKMVVRKRLPYGEIRCRIENEENFDFIEIL